jgi:hypothetical protein
MRHSIRNYLYYGADVTALDTKVIIAGDNLKYMSGHTSPYIFGSGRQRNVRIQFSTV